MGMHEGLLDLYKTYVNYSKEERIDFGKIVHQDIINELHKFDISEENIAYFFVATFKYFVSADRNMTTPEYELFEGITNTGYSEKEFFDATNRGADPEFMSKYESLCSGLTTHGKLALVNFGLLILSADDSLTIEEQDMIEDFIQKLNQ